MQTADFIFSKLRPHQPELVRRLVAILQTYKSGVDLSDTGVGKTYVAAAAASLLRLPTLIVCPDIARSTWERAADHFGDSFSIVGYEMLRTGRTPFGTWDNPDPRPRTFFKCQVCQCEVDLDKFTPCPHHHMGIHCLETHKKPARYGNFHFHPNVKHVIFDEVHRCGGDSLNSDMLIAARRDGAMVTGLSATAACNPLNMRALGYVLDIHNLNTDLLGPHPAGFGLQMKKPSYDRWLRAQGCQRDQRFRGWKWLVGVERQREYMLTLRSQIIPERGVRLSWKDIPGFPDRQITAELYDLDHPEKVDGCYQQMAEALARLNDRATGYKNPDLRLTAIHHERQQVELLKVPVFTELGRDYLEKGHSVVFFVNFKETIAELKKRFPEAEIIDGSPESKRNRDKYVERFQSNQLRVLIVNCDAGGLALSLHDLDGLHARVGIVSPGFSAIVLRQVFGRLHRDGGKSPALYRVIFANKTIEVQVHRAVAPKLDNIDALNDADLIPSNLQLQ